MNMARPIRETPILVGKDAERFVKVIIALKQYRLYHSNDTTLLAWLQVSLFTWLAIPVKRVIGTWS